MIIFDLILDIQKNAGLISKRLQIYKINSDNILRDLIKVEIYRIHPSLKPCNFKVRYSVISKFVLYFISKYNDYGANFKF